MNEHWLKKVWDNRNDKLNGNLEQFENEVGTPPNYFSRIDAKIVAPITSHLRSYEEYLNQILCWILNTENEQFATFRTNFLKKIAVDLTSKKIKFHAEVQIWENGKVTSRYDMAIYEGALDKQRLIAIIECKVGADFDFRQLPKYRDDLKRSDAAKTYLVTLTRFYHKPDSSLKQLYWHEIYAMLDDLKCDEIKEEVQEVFRECALDCREFAVGEVDLKKRRGIIDEIRDIVNKYKNRGYQISENRTNCKKGFCNFIIYNDSMQKIPGTGSKAIVRMPSLNVMLRGFWIGGAGTDKECNHYELISVSASVYYKFDDWKSPPAEEICESLKNSHPANWEYKEIGKGKEKLVRGQIDYRDGKEKLEKYMEEVRHFLNARFEEWEKAIENCQ